MKLILIICLFPILCFSQQRSEWLTDDAKHYYAGALITYTASSFLCKKMDNQYLACLSGIGVGIGAGLAKEYIYDREMHMGVFNKGDYQMTGWGSICCGSLFLCIIDFNRPVKNKKPKDTK